MTGWTDVVILGGGIAGLVAAYRLRDLDVEIIDRESHIGGRTLSQNLGGDVWANYAAQYLSADKVTMIGLCEELGVELLRSPFVEADIRGLDGLSSSQQADIDEVKRRIEAEQANPRDPLTPELDQLSFAQWLGAPPPHVMEHYDHWCSSLMCATSAETSMYGVLLLWGNQRTAAFNNQPVARSNRGDVVIKGGTQTLSKALALASGARVSLNAEVVSVDPISGGYRVEVTGPDGIRQIKSRRLVCALPAPVAGNVLNELPDWKRNALAEIRYGRFLATPIAISPADERPAAIALTRSRPRQVYNSNNFALKTPGDIDRDGGCYHSYVYDSYARQIWDDPDHMIKTGVARSLLQAFPEYAGRIRWMDVKRWRYGLPIYAPGRMAIQPAIEASVDDIHFCGDYVLRSNTDGAARSGENVANRVLDSLR